MSVMTRGYHPKLGRDASASSMRRDAATLASALCWMNRQWLEGWVAVNMGWSSLMGRGNMMGKYG